jgi:hypothetical protein
MGIHGPAGGVFLFLSFYSCSLDKMPIIFISVILFRLELCGSSQYLWNSLFMTIPTIPNMTYLVIVTTLVIELSPHWLTKKSFVTSLT